MAVVINGSTGIDKVQDGTITSADLASGVGGKVLQVVSVNSNTAVTVTSSSYVDVSISASITPSATSSKIFVVANLANTVYSTGSATVAGVQIVRDSTAITSKRYGVYRNAGSDNNIYSGVNLSIVDSPSTTSAVTYKIQAKQLGATNTTFEGSNGTSTLTLMEIAG